MKAAIFHGIENIKIDEIPTPDCNENEILVEVKYCAICGTDVRVYYSGHKKITPPAILGHEITGIVKKIGKNVKNIEVKQGDKVVVVTSIGCGEENCRIR